MTKNQFWLLNLVSAILIVLLFAHLFFSRANNSLGAQLNAQRAYVNNARQLQPVLENMAQRIATAGENDPKLKALLTKYDIRITLPPETTAEKQPATRSAPAR
jgi:hypothetical protein